MQLLLVNNDNDVELKELSDRRDGEVINDATVTYTLKTTGGATVTTGSLTYVADSSGSYRGTIESSVSLTAEQEYRLTVTAVHGTINGEWTIPCKAQTRTQ